MVRMTGLEPARPCGDTDTSSQRVYHSATCANKTDSGVTIVRILPPFSAGVSACRNVTGARRVRSQLDGYLIAGNSLSGLVAARSGYDPNFQERARRRVPCPQRDSNSRPLHP